MQQTEKKRASKRAVMAGRREDRRKQTSPRQFVQDRDAPRKRARVYPCRWEGCDFVASLPRILAEHAQKDHVDTCLDFTCRWGNCKISSARGQRAWLQRHVMQHIGVLPYPCPMARCTQSFNSAAALSAHVESHLKQKKKEEAKQLRESVLAQFPIHEALPPESIQHWMSELAANPNPATNQSTATEQCEVVAKLDASGPRPHYLVVTSQGSTVWVHLEGDSHDVGETVDVPLPLLGVAQETTRLPHTPGHCYLPDM